MNSIVAGLNERYNDNTNTNTCPSNINNSACVGSSTKSDTVTSTHSHLRQEPFCFIVDTDSVRFVIDTGTNRKLLHNLKLTSDKIKGIGGKCVRITGTGDLTLPLRSDTDDLDVVTKLHAAFVPSCPYKFNTSSRTAYTNEATRL